MRSVIATKGRETVSPLSRTLSGAWQCGATKSSADRSWLLSEASSSTVPPGQPGRAQRKGEGSRTGLRALRGECPEQCANGPAAHGLVCHEVINAIGLQADERGEKPCGGAGVADIYFRFADRNFTAAARNGDRQRSLVGLHAETQHLQGRRHDARVATEQGAVQRDGRAAQRGEKKRAVGDALGTRQQDLTARGPVEGTDGQGIGQGHQGSGRKSRR
jgi:hypothetical protein